MDMVVLATYKLPAGLLKKAMHKRKGRLQKRKKKTEALLDHGPVKADNAGLGLGPTLEEHLAKEVEVGRRDVGPVQRDRVLEKRFSEPPPTTK